MKYATWYCCLLLISFSQIMLSMNLQTPESPKQVARPKTPLVEFLGPFYFELIGEHVLKPCAQSHPLASQDNILEDTILFRRFDS